MTLFRLLVQVVVESSKYLLLLTEFACAHCGTEHIVKRGDGIIFLQPVVEGLQKVQSGVDKTASELAIKRLLAEIAATQTMRDEEAAQWQMNLGWAIFVILMFAMASFFCVITGGPVTPQIVTVVSTVVVTFLIVAFLNKKKKEQEEKTSKKYDGLISAKYKELRYHQDIVSRY